MQGHVSSCAAMSENENNSGTIDDAPSGVKRLCSYIEAESWEAGSPPFCDAPALPGSSYCARHAGRCVSAAAVPDEVEPSYPLCEETDEDTEPFGFPVRRLRPCDDDGEDDYGEVGR